MTQYLPRTGMKVSPDFTPFKVLWLTFANFGPLDAHATCVALHHPQKKTFFCRFFAQIYDWKHLYLCIFLVRHSVILP